MKTIRLSQKTGNDGSLSLVVPLDQPDREYEMVIVFQPIETTAPAQTPEERGWPPGYFEKTYGSIDDETFFRHPQGELPKPVEFD